MQNFVFLFLLLGTFSATAATSQSNRASKSMEVSVGYGQVLKTTTSQVKLSHFIDQDNLLGLRAAVGKDDDDKETSFALEYKHFTGNSFYLAPEIYYLNYSEEDHSSNIFDYEDEKIRAMGIAFKIGNQWQWSNFTLGADWIGIGRNVAHWNRTEEFLSHDFTFTFLNVYAGLSF